MSYISYIGRIGRNAQIKVGDVVHEIRLSHPESGKRILYYSVSDSLGLQYDIDSGEMRMSGPLDEYPRCQIDEMYRAMILLRRVKALINSGEIDFSL